MKITKKTRINEGDVIVLPSRELVKIMAICREPDGIYYRILFGDMDGDDFIPEGELRIMEHYELVGGDM